MSPYTHLTDQAVLRFCPLLPKDSDSSCWVGDPRGFPRQDHLQEWSPMSRRVASARCWNGSPSPSWTLCLRFPTKDLVFPSNLCVKRKQGAITFDEGGKTIRQCCKGQAWPLRRAGGGWKAEEGSEGQGGAGRKGSARNLKASFLWSVQALPAGIQGQIKELEQHITLEGLEVERAESLRALLRALCHCGPQFPQQ